MGAPDEGVPGVAGSKDGTAESRPAEETGTDPGQEKPGSRGEQGEGGGGGGGGD